MNGIQGNGHITTIYLEKHRRKGSDPLISTARGKLQSKRSKVNDQINRELRMRNGAENLFRATGNKRLKELVAVELSFFNSNIQLLKEELSELNSCMDVYQSENGSKCIPMIPLGLKETTDIDMQVPVKDFILEHYSEEGDNYEGEIEEFTGLRKAIRTPQRNDSGVELLTEYLNQLYYFEKRFFPADRVLGVPHIQKTMGFEKGSVLFNIGALYTQIACKQDKEKMSISRAAWAIFTVKVNPPSMDMQPQTLTMLIQLMMSQAQESVFDGVVNAGKTEGILGYMKIAQEAVVVSQMYDDTHLLMSTEPVKDYIPYSWISMALVKSQYYKALAHDYMAFGILDQKDCIDEEKMKIFMESQGTNSDTENSNTVLKTPTTAEERILLGKAHLKESLICHEEALRFHDLCKQLRKIDTFQEILKKAHDRALEKFSSLEEEDDFTEVVLSPVIHAKTDQPVLPLAPEFSKVTVTDIFKTLGPISIFNAKNEWSVPRTVVLEKSTTQGFGFSVRGDSPVIVADIETGSVAEKSKLKVGDFVVAVGGKDTKWSKHEEVVKMVRQYGNHIELKVITPLNVLETTRRSSASSSPGTPAKMQSPRDSVSSHSVKSNRSRLSAPWIFMRKGSREKPDKIERSKEVEDGDIFLR
ncbi:hypothetical protein KUTeg_019695 [Tegillarca granosa]|uniref:Rhophilin-2 n=1 Tax=Tegillarca granosa TaxID=220873 RepID=A0ABQ9EFC3_TEGGR|nr:hypothetical protein KUTeg_019695 [Tegillarca granosa]